MRDELHGDEPIEEPILGEPHAAHTASAERLDQTVFVELRRRCPGGLRVDRDARDESEQRIGALGVVELVLPHYRAW